MIYLITRNNANWCEYDSFVIRAQNEEETIKIAQEKEEQFNPKKTKINVELINESGESTIILSSNVGA